VSGSGLVGVAVVVTSQGDQVYYSETNPPGVYNLNTKQLISGNFTNPHSLVVDSAGNLYVADYAMNTIYKISNPSSGGSKLPVAILSANQPTGLVFTSSGSMVVIAQNSGTGGLVIAR